MKTLSLGITVPDKFYELARKNEDMYLFSPYNVEKEYGIPFNYLDITNMYDELVANPKITKTKIKARDLETEISKLQQESGYPYIINIDTANKANPIDGKIIMSNLCSEILQVQTPSLINDAQEFLQMGTDISCNLGSTNILNMMTSPDFGRSIKAMTRALTFVTDSSSIEAVPTIKHGNSQAHTFGLGAMGLHSYLAQHHIEYGSPESVEFTDIYFMLMNYWTLVESNNIARERQTTFVGFDKSKYADGTYFDKYVTGQFVPKSDLVKDLFKDHFIPQASDWEALRDAVQKMVFIIKTVLQLLQMALFLISMTALLLFTPSHNASKSVKKRKLVRFTTQQMACQRILSLITRLRTIWTCVRLSMSMPLRPNMWIKVCL